MGRLRRTTSIMRHRLPTPEPFSADEGARGGPPPLVEQRDNRALATAGPTDPEVYNRRPTPHPGPGPVYEIPQLPIPSLITPTSDLIREILDEIDREPSPGRDVVGDVRPPDNEAPPPAYENVTPHRPATSASQHNLCECNCELKPSDYVRMAPQPTRSRTIQVPTPPPSSHSGGTQETGRAREGYEALAEAQPYIHSRGERTIPIPQGSPPLPRPREVPMPHYIRDYCNPDILPAYSLICLSTWYAQISTDVIMCAECATSEHSFCVRLRSTPTVWRHLHVISRTFEHTSLHCGRCYKLLLKTRRAIDCYHCRICVLEMRDSIERLTYKVLCETSVPRGI